jgi:hypothetical protein
LANRLTICRSAHRSLRATIPRKTSRPTCGEPTGLPSAGGLRRYLLYTPGAGKYRVLEETTADADGQEGHAVVQRRLRALHRFLQPARTDICAPPSHSGPRTRAAAFPGTLIPGTASQVRPTDKRTGEVQAYAAFPWASDEVLCWERRREMLRAELVSCEADVICLQVGATSIPKITPLILSPSSLVSLLLDRYGHYWLLPPSAVIVAVVFSVALSRRCSSRQSVGPTTSGCLSGSSCRITAPRSPQRGSCARWAHPNAQLRRDPRQARTGCRTSPDELIFCVIDGWMDR